MICLIWEAKFEDNPFQCDSMVYDRIYGTGLWNSYLVGGRIEVCQRNIEKIILYYIQ